MRKESTFIVVSLLGLLGLLALAGTARAEDAFKPAAPAPPAANVVAPVPVVEAPPPEKRRKLLVGASFLPMAMGKYKFADSVTSTTTQDAFFAYGVGLSGSYEVLPGLLVGLAPQYIFNVQPKPNDIFNPLSSTELDIMARVAYAYRLVDTISVYAEALPGYSFILPSDPTAGRAKGFVLGFDAGAMVDMTDRTFFNVAAGYQIGFQAVPSGLHDLDLQTRYVRVAIGGGAKF